MEELESMSGGLGRRPARCAPSRGRLPCSRSVLQLLTVMWALPPQAATAVQLGAAGGLRPLMPSSHRLSRPPTCGFVFLGTSRSPPLLSPMDRRGVHLRQSSAVDRAVCPPGVRSTSWRCMVKQVPEDDPLVQDGLGPAPPPPSPLSLPDSWAGPAALASVLVLVTMLLYMLAPHTTSASTELQAALDHLGQEVSSRLVPPGYHFYQSLLSGAFAGISRGISRLATFPLDTVKTRQQAVLNQEVAKEKLEDKAKRVNTKNLFDGILPMLLIAAPANAAFFVTHDYVIAAVKAVSAFPKSALWVVELSASLLASLPANAIRIPAEVTKQRVQAGVEKTALAATASILRDEGFAGLYVGGKAHLLRELPFNAIQFLTFDSLKSLLLSEGIKVGVGQKALLGAVAAGVAGLGTQPFDVIKTLEMIDKNRSVVSKESWLDTAGRIYQTYGVSGLYLGLIPRLLLCSVGGAFYFLASEAVKGFFSAQMGGGAI